MRDAPIVDTLVQWTSEIDHQASQIQRPFQYGKIENDEILAVFEKQNWRSGRFGDGQDYGVWYGAEDEITSVYEASWVAYRLGRDNIFPAGQIYTTDRSMFEACIETKLLADLTPRKDCFSQLVNPTDYSFCQALGKKLIQENFQMIRTPSARRRDGICTPVLSPDPIKKWSFLYYLKIHIHPDGFIGVNSTHTPLNFSLEASQLESPYGMESTIKIKS